MKDMITTIAAIAILMVFVLQFSCNQVLAGKILASDRTVDRYIGILTEKGRTEAPEKELLACQLAQCLGCDQAEVKVMEEDGRYEVRAPIRGIIACGEFLGISSEENMTEYVVKGNVN